MINTTIFPVQFDGINRIVSASMPKTAYFVDNMIFSSHHTINCYIKNSWIKLYLINKLVSFFSSALFALTTNSDSCSMVMPMIYIRFHNSL